MLFQAIAIFQLYVEKMWKKYTKQHYVYMYTPFEYKMKYQQEGITKIKSMLFQAIAIFRLNVEKIWKKTILSGTTLNESNFFVEGQFACSLTCEK